MIYLSYLCHTVPRFNVNYHFVDKSNIAKMVNSVFDSVANIVGNGETLVSDHHCLLFLLWSQKPSFLGLFSSLPNNKILD